MIVAPWSRALPPARTASSCSAVRKQALDLRFQCAPALAVNAAVWRSMSGVVMLQPRLVQLVDRRDPFDPFLAPAGEPCLTGRTMDEVAALMRPAPTEDHRTVEFARHCLVGREAIADEEEGACRAAPNNCGGRPWRCARDRCGSRPRRRSPRSTARRGWMRSASFSDWTRQPVSSPWRTVSP